MIGLHGSLTRASATISYMRFRKIISSAKQEKIFNKPIGAEAVDNVGGIQEAGSLGAGRRNAMAQKEQNKSRARVLKM
jgi:hypothetical protein